MAGCIPGTAIGKAPWTRSERRLSCGRGGWGWRAESSSGETARSDTWQSRQLVTAGEGRRMAAKEMPEDQPQRGYERAVWLELGQPAAQHGAEFMVSIMQPLLTPPHPGTGTPRLTQAPMHRRPHNSGTNTAPPPGVVKHVLDVTVGRPLSRLPDVLEGRLRADR